MKRNISLLLLLLIPLCSTFAQTKPQNLENPVVATFWGAFQRFKHFTHNKGEVINLRSSYFKSGSIEVYFSQQLGKAPLFVFMPGIFGGLTKGLTPQMIDRLEAMGGHVLVVPNLLAPEYMHAHPLYGEDPIALEVKVMEEALNYALQKIGPDVGAIHVMSESLGTAVGSAWVAWDRNHAKRVQSLTLLWPPLNLAKAMKNFDRVVDEHRKAANRCSFLEKIWIFSKEFMFKDFPGILDKTEQDCIGVLVLIDGFIKNTKQSWKAHAEVNGRKEAEPESFEAFFRQYRPELWKLIENNDERVQLSHWMSIIKKDSAFPVRIMTSQNDFLIFGQDWSHFIQQSHLGPKEIMILPWGGHSGPIGMKEFTHLLKSYSPIGGNRVQ